MKEKILILCCIFFTTVFTVQAQVTIGSGLEPDESALLDLKQQADGTSIKGFLAPRVALANITDVLTISNPAIGLLVYNIGTGGLNYRGYVFWNGSEWRAFNNLSLEEGTIGSITCNGVSLTPGIYKAGEPYEGTMIVPYTGSNGGIYPAQTLGPTNGLTAVLAPGNFSVGAGNLAYTITGTPTLTTPETTTFSINIGGKTCEAIIGAGDVIEPGNLVYYSTSMNAGLAGVWLSNYANDLPIIGGKLRLDAYFNVSSNQGNGAVTMYPRLVNITSAPVKLWFSAMTTVDRFNAGNYLMAPNGYVELDNGIYYGYGFNDILGVTAPRTSGSGDGGNQEVVTVDLSLDDRWYRIYYFPIVDNMNTVPTDDNLRKIYLSIQRLY